MNSASRYTKQVISERGWLPGTTLENRVADLLHRSDHRPGYRPHTARYRNGRVPGLVAQQHYVAPFHLDFAWPDYLIALEADGWWHRSPEGAAKDAERDARLRAQGWLVFRVDDLDGDDGLEAQVFRVSQIVHMIKQHRP